ncbi:LysE family transporter [Brevibacillus dissolubilis]|uniref:LysE family transporter n=1 Tax=Brevibacillus dissolubilis TaxID=1844116 RepID=UPI0011179236|nr:LysE family transporter [Brevibacillus dissolubilis]
MNIFVGYILLGLTLAAPIGPVNAAQLDKGIKYGFLHAYLVGFGAMVADGLFMLLIYFGSAHFLTTPFMKTFLYVFGTFVLLYTGIESIINANVSQSRSQAKDEPVSRSFYSGFLMTLSNPISILFWLGIYGSILAKTAETYGAWDLLIYSSGIFIGLALWDLIMATVASSFHNFVNQRVLVLISQGSGLCLIGFGIYFGYQAIQMLSY